VIGCLSFYVILGYGMTRHLAGPSIDATRFDTNRESKGHTSALTSISAYATYVHNNLEYLPTLSSLQMSLKRSPSPTPLTESTSANPAKQPKMSSSSITNTPTPLPASAGMQVKRLSERATLPTRGSPLAAGYDLYA
jgi:hypothetical protein